MRKSTSRTLIANRRLLTTKVRKVGGLPFDAGGVRVWGSSPHISTTRCCTSRAQRRSDRLGSAPFWTLLAAFDSQFDGHKCLGAARAWNKQRAEEGTYFMTLSKTGEYSYGDSQQDIQTFLTEYANSNEYPIAHFADARCTCVNSTFQLWIDDTEGAAIRVCTACKVEHPMGDRAEYLEDAELGEAECPCGSNSFEITVGVALYEESEDVKWLYLGCRCTQCSLVACYGHWKNEYIGYRELLDAI